MGAGGLGGCDHVSMRGGTVDNVVDRHVSFQRMNWERLTPTIRAYMTSVQVAELLPLRRGYYPIRDFLKSGLQPSFSSR